MAAERRRTKIVATIGPVSSTHDQVRALVDAGVDAIRLNLSHGNHQNHAERVQVVREVQEEIGKPLALIADLQGPKLRIGDLPSPRILLKDEEVIVVGEQSAANGELPVAPGRDRRGAPSGPRRPDRRRPGAALRAGGRSTGARAAASSSAAR